MNFTLPPDLSDQIEQLVASGRYPSCDVLIEQAVRSFLDEDRQAQRRLEALRRISHAVDETGLYEKALENALDQVNVQALDEEAWRQRFARNREVLRRMAREALAEDERGETLPLTNLL